MLMQNCGVQEVFDAIDIIDKSKRIQSMSLLTFTDEAKFNCLINGGYEKPMFKTDKELEAEEEFGGGFLSL